MQKKYSGQEDVKENYFSLKLVVKVALNSGERVGIVGDIDHLGSWQEKRAIFLTPSPSLGGKDLWVTTYPILLPINKKIQYKFIKCMDKGTVIWEPPEFVNHVVFHKKSEAIVIFHEFGKLESKTEKEKGSPPIPEGIPDKKTNSYAGSPSDFFTPTLKKDLVLNYTNYKVASNFRGIR